MARAKAISEELAPGRCLARLLQRRTGAYWQAGWEWIVEERAARRQPAGM
jgi:hypothetical protein